MSKINARDYYKNHDILSFVEYIGENASQGDTKSHTTSTIKYTLKCKKAGHVRDVSGNNKNKDRCLDCDKEEKKQAKKEEEKKVEEKKKQEVKIVEEKKKEEEPKIESKKESKYTLISESNIIHVQDDVEDSHNDVIFSTIEKEKDRDENAVYIPQGKALIIDDIVIVNSIPSFLSKISSEYQSVNIKKSFISENDGYRKRKFTAKDVELIKDTLGVDLSKFAGTPLFSKMQFPFKKTKLNILMFLLYSKVIKENKDYNIKNITTITKDALKEELTLSKDEITFVDLFYERKPTDDELKHDEAYFMKFYLQKKDVAKKKEIRDFKKKYLEDDFYDDNYVPTKAERALFTDKVIDIYKLD